MWFVLYKRDDLEIVVMLHADEVGLTPTLGQLEQLASKKLDATIGPLPVTLHFVDAFTQRPR